MRSQMKLARKSIVPIGVCLMALILVISTARSGLPPQQPQVSDPLLEGKLVAYCSATCAEECRGEPVVTHPPSMGQPQPAGCLVACHKRCPSITGGVVYPKYILMALMYAPPGCTPTAQYRCSTNALVDYSDASSNGTRISIQNSFKDATIASASIGLTLPGIGSLSLGSDAGFGITSTETTSQTITKTVGHDLKIQGNSDGIQHDQDLFEVLVNPVIIVGVGGPFVDWTVGYSSSFPEIVDVYAGELKNPSTMRTAVAESFSRHGLTTEDYQTLLSQDPFASGVTVPDPHRYVPTTFSFPYEPPLVSAACSGGVCTCPTNSYTLKNDFQSEVSSQFQTQYSVGITIGSKAGGSSSGGESGNGDASSLGWKASDSMTWTSTATTANTKGSTSSAAATLSCPGTGYTGSIQMLVYWDTIYGSFLFVPASSDLRLTVLQKGSVVDLAGKPAAGQLISLSYGNSEYHTLTSQKGEFMVYGTKKKNVAQARLSLAKTSKAVVVGSRSPLKLQLQ